jgi:hypothetical protein
LRDDDRNIRTRADEVNSTDGCATCSESGSPSDVEPVATEYLFGDTGLPEERRGKSRAGQRLTGLSGPASGFYFFELFLPFPFPFPLEIPLGDPLLLLFP